MRLSLTSFARATCAALCLLIFPSATSNAGAMTAAEIDLLLRMHTPPGDVVREVSRRKLQEPLTAEQESKLLANGATPELLATVKAQTLPPPELTQAFTWPRVGEPYPALCLQDPDGRVVRLEDFRGKLLLIEPIGFSCAACQAFSGGHVVGEFHCPDSHGVQPDLPSIEDLFRRFAPGVAFDDARIVYVQLLFYNSMTSAPTLEQARQWRAHFSSTWKKHPVILVGTLDLLRSVPIERIPGFQLVDREFVLRFDTTGHQPVHNLYNELLPGVAKLLR
jgi:hypothetical protein